MKKMVLLLASLSAIASPTAFAEPAYQAEDIVQFYIETARFGSARAICVGTAAECNPVTQPKVEALDALVTFELDSDTLTSQAKKNLDQFAIALNDPRLEVATFSVEGHTDALGGEIYNQDLSERRALAVENYLVSKGVEQQRLTAVGFGMTKPAVADDPFNPLNRRVETRLVLPQ